MTTRQPAGIARSDFLWIATVSVPAACALIVLTLEADAAGSAAPLAFLASSLACGALPVALRRPFGATVMQAVAVVALGLGPSSEIVSAQFPVVLLLVVMAHVGLVGVHHDWRVAAGVWWTLNGTGVLVASVDDRATTPDVTTTVVVLAVGSLVALFTGIGYRQRLRIRAELARARLDIALEQELRILAEERTRIARELHDVVAHSMSVIHMQATSAPYRLADLDVATREEFTSIAAGARGALGEMRQLLGVLRGSGTEPDTAPAPGVAELAALVEATGRAGASCTLVVDADVGELPAVVGTIVYRMVQEALSNVLRHTGGAAATVRLRAERGGVEVEVVNGPGGRAGLPPDDPDRSRHGLTGMRERVAQLGGELIHGTVPGGGFRVSAWLPRPGGHGA